MKKDYKNWLKELKNPYYKNYKFSYLYEEIERHLTNNGYDSKGFFQVEFIEKDRRSGIFENKDIQLCTFKVKYYWKNGDIVKTIIRYI